MVKLPFCTLLMCIIVAKGMFFPFNAEMDDVEQMIRSSQLYNSEINPDIFSQILIEESQPHINQDPACYENIDIFCQAIELPRCRNILAESLFLIITMPVELWLLHEQERVKLEAIFDSLVHPHVQLADRINVACLRLLSAIIKNDSDGVAQYLTTLPCRFHGKVIISLAVFMYYLSIELPISELLIKLDDLKIAANNRIGLTNFARDLLRTTKQLLRMFQVDGSDVAQELNNTMENCDQYLIFLPIIEQYKLRMGKIITRYN